MSKSKYRSLSREYRQKNRLCPDNGRSVRPWERPLREKIEQAIRDALEQGASWAKEAARDWDIQ